MNHNEAAALFATARYPHQGKPLGGNTRLHKRGDNYAVCLYGTDVVTFLPDGRIVLDSGRWRTVTTQARIHEFAAPVRVYGDPTSSERPCPWVIASHTIGHTAPKVQKCRVCHGTGLVPRYGRWAQVTDEQRAETRTCGRCGGEGVRDYGSKPLHPPFHDGIVVDASGHVVGLGALVDA